DRIGKGIRDAPRDALLVDVTPPGSRGSGFGLRLALYTVGAIVGPLTAMALMVLSDGDFRLVFAVAAIPAFASVAALLLWVTEPAVPVPGGERRPLLRRGDLARLPPAFWWAIAVASLLALARCSYAFLILGAHHAGVDAALVPLMLVLMHVVYSAAAYPCGVLADRSDRRRQLGVGIFVLIAADLALAADGPVWLVAVGAGLWGLQLGVTQGLLSAAIADAAPEDLRGTSFGIYETAIGVATFLASAGAGLLWAMAGPAATFGTGAAIAAAAGILLLLRPAPGAAAR
ncbi:MAG: MFS transporter, partial [Alphaproteobacteria bacterium]|nr:MFS transporter [Alphaproteobacteria bacterium]